MNICGGIFLTLFIKTAKEIFSWKFPMEIYLNEINILLIHMIEYVWHVYVCVCVCVVKIKSNFIPENCKWKNM